MVVSADYHVHWHVKAKRTLQRNLSGMQKLTTSSNSHSGVAFHAQAPFAMQVDTGTLAADLEGERLQHDDLSSQDVQTAGVASQVSRFDAQHASDRPVVAILVGPNFEHYSSPELKIKILEDIRHRKTKCSNMLLRGRTQDGFRIDYCPDSHGIFSISSRLDNPLSKRDLEAIGTLLRPLVKSNREAFPEAFEGHAKIKSKGPNFKKIDATSFTSCWVYKKHVLTRIGPISSSKQTKVVHAIVKAYRDQCTKLQSSSPLLDNPNGPEMRQEEDHTRQHAIEWNLHGTKLGFATKLLACFEQDRSSEEYDDMLEREMYLFKLANRSAVYMA
jgi:hypothetical protein